MPEYQGRGGGVAHRGREGADDDAAPGEPEEGTPKLKPRADTFDGPAL